jgi:hypothetical protein
MTPDELMKILKRYLRESNEDERTLAARIGVNHQTLSLLAHIQSKPDKGKVGFSRMFPQARRIPVSVFSGETCI